MLRGGPVERAELAAVDADVRVVDVAVDDVGRDGRVVLAVADLVGRGAELEEAALREEGDGVRRGEPLARERAVEDLFGARRLTSRILAGRAQLRSERAGGRDQPVLGREPVEEVEPLEVAGVELVVERVAQVVLDDRLGQARRGRLLARRARSKSRRPASYERRSSAAASAVAALLARPPRTRRRTGVPRRPATPPPGRGRRGRSAASSAPGRR